MEYTPLVGYHAHVGARAVEATLHMTWIGNLFRRKHVDGGSDAAPVTSASWRTHKSAPHCVRVFGDWRQISFKYPATAAHSAHTVGNVPSDAAFAAMALRILLNDSTDASHCVVESNLSSIPTSPDAEWDLQLNPTVDPFDQARTHAFRIPDAMLTPRRLNADSPSATTSDTTTVNTNATAIPDFIVIHEGSGKWRTANETKRDSGDHPSTRTTSRDSTKEATACANLIGQIAASANRKPTWPRIFTIFHDLPGMSTNPGRTFESDVWESLWGAREHVCLLHSANALRRAGVAVSRRLSWEQSIEDFFADTHLDARLRKLTEFSDLLIRFGHTGVLHCGTGRLGLSASPRFVFAPLAPSLFLRDSWDEGRVTGKNVMLVTALISEATKSAPPGDDQRQPCFDRAIEFGLSASMRLFTQGYPSRPVSELENRLEPEDFVGGYLDPVKTLLSRVRGGSSHAISLHRQYRFARTSVPARIVTSTPSISPLQRQHWEILRESINVSAVDGTAQRGPSRVNIATAIVRFGHDFVLNRDLSSFSSDKSARDPTDPIEIAMRILSQSSCRFAEEEPPDHSTLPEGRLPLQPLPGLRQMGVARSYWPIWAPIAEFGRLVTLERTEIEALRSVRGLFRVHIDRYGPSHALEDRLSGKPLSVAVFGPPGTGKSFAIKQIVESLESIDGTPRGLKRVKIIEINMSQLRDARDFEGALRPFRETFKLASGNPSVGSSDYEPLPVVFFDEFDADCDGIRLGWLKYFLAPMQDGVFHGATSTTHFGASILVFAGGTSHHFTAFDPSDLMSRPVEHYSPLEIRALIEEFRVRKGPDFVSRLSGYVDIRPVDARPGMTKPMIRRALVIRAAARGMSDIVTRRTAANGMITNVEDVRIDHDVLYAMLTIDRYRHGARSIQAILRMSVPIDGRIMAASLPSRAQLDMHVDAEEFLIRLQRGRVREMSEKDRWLAPRASAGADPGASHRPTGVGGI